MTIPLVFFWIIFEMICICMHVGDGIILFEMCRKGLIAMIEMMNIHGYPRLHVTNLVFIFMSIK